MENIIYNELRVRGCQVGYKTKQNRKGHAGKDVIKPWHDDDGILTMGIYDFLLNEHSLDI